MTKECVRANAKLVLPDEVIHAALPNAAQAAGVFDRPERRSVVRGVWFLFGRIA